jgi:preprotein translocase subunit SecG
MIGLLSALIILASILLVVVVFVQNPKGGGISSDFGAAQQLGGVQRTSDFIEKATWVLASVVGICAIFMTTLSTDNVSRIDQNAKPNTEAPGGPTGGTPKAPAAPAAPAQRQ